MKILIVVGARPNFMKAAPVVFAIHDHNARVAALSSHSPTAAEQIQPVLVHTGQHYDEALSGSFFSDLGLPKPDVHLEVGSGSHAVHLGGSLLFLGGLVDLTGDVDGGSAIVRGVGTIQEPIWELISAGLK